MSEKLAKLSFTFWFSPLLIHMANYKYLMALALLILPAGPALGQTTGAMVLTPSQLQFPTAQVGSASAPAAATLTNVGAETVSGISIAVSGDFSEHTTCNSSLKAGASCQTRVTFAPNAPGLRSGSLTVTYAGQTAPATVSLSGQAYALLSISIAPQTASIPIGAGRQFHALGAYSDGSVKDISASVAWTSTDTTKLTVANSGVATGIAAGSVQITATWLAVSATVNVIVTTATLVSLDVDTLQLSMPQGYAEQFNVVGSYSDGTQLVLTDQVIWTSSAPAVASVSAAGMVDTVNPGTVLITAALGSVSSSAPLSVAAATLQSIAILPANVSLATSTILQLQATGTYSDGSTRSLTNVASWSSSATNIATISAIGRIASGAQAGSATISATFAGIAASAAATVGSTRLKSIVITTGKPFTTNGSSQVFMATGTFSDGSSQDVSLLVHWMSSVAAIATVSNTLQWEGVANALAPGGTAITASYLPSVSAQVGLKVDTAALVSIAITPANIVAPSGSAFQFTAAGTYSDLTIRNITQSVTWSSASPSTLLVSNDPGSQGFGYGLAAGQDMVTATLGSVDGSTPFAIAAPNLISIAVSPQTAAIVAGNTQQFTATGTYGDGSTQDLTATAAWNSSLPAAATVGSSPGSGGLALGVAQGQATIVAASGAISGSGQLTVSPPQLVGIAVTPANPTVMVGGSQQFAATGTYTDGSTQNLTATAAWSASPATDATIGNAAGSQGLAQALAAGQAAITAASGAIAGAAVLTISSTPPQLTGLSVSPSTASVFSGSAQQFAATGTYSYGGPQNLTAIVTWSAGPNTVATIANTAGSQGLAQAIATGTATITATSGTDSATAQLQVNEVLTSISVLPSSASIGVGGAQQYTATGAFSDGTTGNLTATATWSVSPSTIATIGNTSGNPGLAQATAPGPATITASFASTAGSATLTVTPLLIGIGVTPADPTLAIGSNQQFAATGTYSDNSTQNLTNQVTWSAAPLSTAAIGPSGVAQALAAGQATITASLGAISNSTMLTVSPPPPTLVSLAIAPLAPSVAVGNSQQFYATGTYSDGSSQELTSIATWTSLSPAVTTIASSGLAAALTIGTSIIGAGVGAIAAPTTLMSVALVALPNLCSAAPTGLPPLPAAAVLPTLPVSCWQPVYPTPTQPPTTVTTFTELQAAVNGASCGAHIVVAAGLSYSGNLVLPGTNCPSNNPILVEGSAIGGLPQWVVPSRSLAGTASFPTLVTPTTGPALQLSDNMSGWYFAGLELTVAPTVQNLYNIVSMGEQTLTTAALPHYVVFDRVLVHPSSVVTNYVVRGIDLNCVICAVISSNIWAIVNPGADTQAINVYNTTGPGLIANNDLEATGENIIFNTECSQTGYNSPWGIPTCPVPSDFTVTRNHLIKQAAWQALPAGCVPGGSPQCYDVKNEWEVKHGQRMLVDSNWFDTTFNGGQAEFLISNCFDPGPYVCQDITVTNNLFTHGPQVGAIAGNGAVPNPMPSNALSVSGSQTGQRALFRNNIAIDINGNTPPTGFAPGAGWGGAGISFQIQNTNGFVMDHNTIVNTPPLYENGLNFSDAQPTTDLNFEATNNFQFGSPFNDGGSPGAAIAALPSPTLGGQVFVGDYWQNPNIWGVPYEPAYPAGIISLTSNATPVDGQLGCQFNNYPIAACWPLDWALVGFTDFVDGNAGTDLAGLVLTPGSQFHAAGTDGLDIGANVAAVLAATNGLQ
jgi:uncharacterized protein YjdB